MKLYHYTTFSGALGILGSKSIWASSIHFLNDKEEFRHGIGLASQMAEALVSTQGSNGQRLLQKIMQMLPGLQKRFLCIASFAEDGDLLSQWRGYAAPGGVSLGFRKEALEAAGREEGFSLLKCVYDPAEKVKRISDYLDLFLTDIENPKNAAESHLWELASAWVFAFQSFASCFKHHSFKEENEWRLISKIIPDYHPRVAVRPGPGLPIPYFSLPLQQVTVNGLVDLGLDSILVGPHRDQELAQAAFDIAAASNQIRIEGAKCSTIPYRSV